jgi:hypothetical protein
MAQEKTVRTTTPAVDKMAENWPVIAALLGGTPAMRAAAAKYLPQWPNEADQAYKNRVATATLFPAFARTVEVLSGKPFSKPLTLEDDTPERIKEWSEDVDLQGRNLHAFAADVCSDAMACGITGVLVDYPRVSNVRTKADEQKIGARPYFVQISFDNILGWKSARINGVETLTQLRFLESAREPDGEFHETEVQQVRVLYPGKWQIWREKEVEGGKKVWALFDEGVSTLQNIPFVPVYGKRTGFMTGVPPLLELAHLNVEHWQSKSDQQTILHVARVPILFAKKLDVDEEGKSKLVIGASSAITCGDPDGDLKYVEHTGAAIEAGRLSLLDLEDMMRQIGAELLVIKPGNTSITQTEADNEPGMCTLQRIAQGLENSLDEALQLMAEWVGEEDGGNVQIFQDYGVDSLAEASMELLRDMNVDGTFSDESLFHEGQRRGLIRPELTWEEEKGRIKQNAPKPSAPTKIDKAAVG